VRSAPASLREAPALEAREAALRQFVDPSGRMADLPTRPGYDTFPLELRSLLTESYLEQLSERFSKAAHEGLYDVAVEAGKTLLALYVLIYPPNYPQIGECVCSIHPFRITQLRMTGVHLLEMAKISWNACFTSGGEDSTITVRRDQTRSYLLAGGRILAVLGAEGDDEGPMSELRTLQSLLSEES
jgi:hypothetical protein